MSNQERTLLKKQRIFFKMPADKLQQYCEKHPLDSLSAGIMNSRFKAALDTMDDCAQDLSRAARTNLATYIKTTFNRGQIAVAPVIFQDIYAPVLAKTSAKRVSLQKALHEFLSFARAPMTTRKHNQLAALVANIDPNKTQPAPRKATAFEVGMDEYRQRTCLFSH